MTSGKLPAELWIKIFREATELPQVFDLLPTRQFTDGVVLTTNYKQKIIRESYPLKRTIVSVCWQWNMIGEQFLYEAILVGRGPVFMSLVRAFTLQRKRGSLPAGRFTKRLDFVGNISLAREYDDYGRQAISDMPNLVIFVESTKRGTIPHISHTPSRCLRSLTEHCSSSLKRIEFTDLAARPYTNELKFLLNKTPNLVYFQCDATFRPLFDGILDPPPNLPNLTQLAYLDTSTRFFSGLRREGEAFIPPRLPSLRHLVIRSPHNIDPTQMAGRREFLGINGPKIQRVELHPASASLGNSATVDILSRCTNHHALIFDIMHARDISDWKPATSKATTIGIRSFLFQAHRALYRKLLFNCISQKWFPNVKTLRILDQRMSDVLLALHRKLLLKGSVHLHTLGVIVLQWNGEPYFSEEELKTVLERRNRKAKLAEPSR